MRPAMSKRVNFQVKIHIIRVFMVSLNINNLTHTLNNALTVAYLY